MHSAEHDSGAMAWSITCSTSKRLLPNPAHLLKESWQVQLSWLGLILQAVEAMHGAVGRVCQEVLLEGIRKAVVPAKRVTALFRT